MKSLALSAEEKSSLLSVVTGASPRMVSLARLLSSPQRDAFFVFYAWVHQAYEITKIQDGDPRKTLRAYKEEFIKVWNGNTTRHLPTMLFVRLAKEYELSKGESLVFLLALEKMQEKNPFSTRKELDAWLSRTAGFIGESSAKILELSSTTEQVLSETVVLLGMSALLRNVGRDWRLYGRVLLPISSLQQYDLERDQLWNRRHTWQWHEFIHDEIERLFTRKQEIEKASSALPKNLLIVIRIVLELESLTMKRLRKQPILCWSIVPVKPSRARFVRTVSWWTWKMRGLPKAKKGVNIGREFFKRSKNLLKRT